MDFSVVLFLVCALGMVFGIVLAVAYIIVTLAYDLYGEWQYRKARKRQLAAKYFSSSNPGAQKR